MENEIIKKFRLFFKKEFNNPSWPEITRNTEQFILSELKALKKDILKEADNPHNMALLGANRKKNIELAVDCYDITESFAKRGI